MSTSYSVLDAGEIQRVHQATLMILENPGIRILDDEARKLLIGAGARPLSDGYVAVGEELLSDALKTVPGQVRLFDRNGRLALETSGSAPCFATGLFCSDLLDHNDHRIRPFLLKDVTTCAKVCDKLDHIHLLGSLGLPADVSSVQAPISAVTEVLKATLKPVMFFGNHERQAAEIWRIIAEKSGGWKTLAERPSAIDLIGPTSPMTLDAQACRRLIFNARRHLPTACYSAVLPGASGPVTLAGALVQASAESLAGIVLQQVAAPGAPVISGSNVLTMDLRSGNLAYAAPEYSLVSQAAVDYLGTLGVPTWIGAGHSDAHCVDAQAAAEAGMSLSLAALSQTALIHNLGYLSGGKTASLEMLVLADELAGAATRLARGIAVDEATLAVEVIRKETASNGFMTSPHTFEHFRSEFHYPALFKRQGLEAWQNQGSADLALRITEKLRDLLDG